MVRELGASAVILVGTSKDPQLEAVWKDPLAFVKALRKAEIDVVFGPAFSIYLGRLPIERLANRARNLRLFRCLSDAGIQTIPAVGFVDAVDATRVGEWVAACGLRSVFVDLQSADTPAHWNLVREALPALIAEGTSLKRIVINGVGQPARVIELARLTEPLDLVLTNQSAFQMAGSRHDYFFKGEKLVKQPSSATPPQLFANLLRFYWDAAAGQDGGYLPLALQPRLF